MVRRRLLVEQLHSGLIRLPEPQARHARDVLRLREGAEVELFTSDGKVAAATLAQVSSQDVVIQVGEIRTTSLPFQLVIASAVPKGNRADWLVEKLSELGVTRWIPLRTARSVVHPQGTEKLQRWQRIANEAARQSHRSGVMEISPLRSIEEMATESAGELQGTARGYLSTSPGCQPILSSIQPAVHAAILLVGPEGGWTDEEEQQLSALGLTALALGGTILRVETAAVAAAAVVAAAVAQRVPPPSTGPAI